MYIEHLNKTPLRRKYGVVLLNTLHLLKFHTLSKPMTQAFWKARKSTFICSFGNIIAEVLEFFGSFRQTGG
jgi:hypothetical protein